MTEKRPQLPDHDLIRLDGFAFATYVSAGEEARGRQVAERTARVLDWLSAQFGEPRSTTLFVVGPADWDRVAAIPLYGMPHAVHDRVVTSTAPAPFWREYLDRIAPALSAGDLARLRSVYGDPPDLGCHFADLVVAHELTHLFHDFDEATGETDFPRLWLAELFANIGFYGYIADNEPEQLPALETICELSRAAGPDPWPVQELNHMGDGLADGPANYIWFEFLLILIAKRIWQTGAASALVDFRTRLRSPALTDAEILERLDEIHPDVAKAVQRWPREVRLGPRSSG